MRKIDTDITVILDKSGSMSSIRDDVIGSFNEFVSKWEKEGVDLHLYAFNNKVDEVTDLRLSSDTYIPKGTTALIDAVCSVIDNTGDRLSRMDESDRPDQVLVVIITDGQENSSREFTTQDMRNRIKYQEEVYKWQFVFLAANQDAFAVGRSYGIGTTGNFTATSKGLRTMTASLDGAVESYRKSGNFDWKDN
jgi:hypothetical protein